MPGLLSHRQSWRRVKHEPKSIGEAAYDLKRFNIVMSEKSLSDPSLKNSGTYFDVLPFLRSLSSSTSSSMTTNSKSSTISPPPIKQKKVSFENTRVRVVLIPTRGEIQKYTIDNPIWWCADDYVEFKADAVKELKALIAENSHLNSRAAIKLLYQPDEYSSL